MVSTMYSIKIACAIMALISSSGDAINVNNLYKLKHRLDGGCNVYQYYNPSIIESDWNCSKVERQIILAIGSGCNKV